MPLLPSPAAPVSDGRWGVVRYAPGSGVFCDDDAAAFDGWYTLRDDALAVAEDWALRFPQWIVALVRSDQGWFGNGNWSAVANHPLTMRERAFAAGRSPRTMRRAAP